jgi:hypothetical protein
MKFRFALFALFFVSIAFSQVPEQIQRYRNDAKGDYQNRRSGIMRGNRIRTLFYNNGEVAKYQVNPSLEWPAGSGHQYLDGYTIMVAAQVTAPGNAQLIHPLETSYRAYMPTDPSTGLIWGFEPIGGYANVSGASIAISNDPGSYPEVWPPALGLSSDWNGQWYGSSGKGTKDSVVESFYVMDDSKDGKYKRSPYLYYPIAADSDRGGLGLRMEVRGIQFSNRRLQDVLFWNYTVINLSDRDYDSTAFGIYLDPGVGGTGSADDNIGLVAAPDLIYSWDILGTGDPSMGIWNTGYAGIGVLKSPNPKDTLDICSMSISALSDKTSTGALAKNNETMWRKMTGGFPDATIPNTSGFVAVVGSNLFKLSQGAGENFDVAMIMGDDLHDIIAKEAFAQSVHDNNFTIPDTVTAVEAENSIVPTEYILDQNFPNPFNPATTIQFAIPSVQMVDVKVYDELGKEMATLVHEKLQPGKYSVRFDGSRLASGMYFYRLTAGEFSLTKKFLLVK